MGENIKKNSFSPKTVLLTGSTGVIGCSIKDYFKKYLPEIRVVCLFNPFSLQNLYDNLKEGNIDYFINASGAPSNDLSLNEPYQTYQTNSFSILNQLEIIRKYSPKTKYITFGSIYEKEGTTPYASSKRNSRDIVKTYRENYHLFCIQATLGFTEYYNRSEKFITRKISKKIAEIYHKTKNGDSFSPLKLENVDDIFYFTWGEDMADGIWKMLNQDVPQEFTVINKRNCSLREFVEAAFNSVGLENSMVEKQNYDRLPVSDFEINNLQHWMPLYSYKEIARMMVESDIKN